MGRFSRNMLYCFARPKAYLSSLGQVWSPRSRSLNLYLGGRGGTSLSKSTISPQINRSYQDYSWTFSNRWMFTNIVLSPPCNITCVKCYVCTQRSHNKRPDFIHPAGRPHRRPSTNSVNLHHEFLYRDTAQQSRSTRSIL